MNSADGQEVGRKRRRDFEENRDLILEAADQTFADLGMGASINAVAERSGVAPATVYRHFPNRRVLVEAVFELRLAAYAEAIDAAQALRDPVAAFRQTIHAVVTLQSRDRSFREIVAARETDPQKDPQFVRFGAALLGAIESARTAGVLREDVAAADILLLLIATEGIARPTAEHSTAALDRFVDVLLDGFCNSRTVLSGEPLEFDQVLGVTRS